METCCICLENIVEGVTNSCKHSYCRGCISEWKNINETCPICRNDLDANLLIKVIYKSHSLIKRLGMESIHEYSMNNNIGHKSMEIVKGDTPDLTDDEKKFIFNISGFNVENKINKLTDNDIFCILNNNIITLGKTKFKVNQEYFLEDGIAIVRQSGTTFPIYPKNRTYKLSSANNIYILS